MTRLALCQAALAGASLVTALSGCDGSNAERVFSPEEVREEFRNHGLPLREVPSGLSGMRQFHSPRAGQVFRVELYETIDAAKVRHGKPILIVTLEGHGPRGDVEGRRRANVRVIYDAGRADIRRRLQTALAALDTS